jgi:hypothetical protein
MLEFGDGSEHFLCYDCIERLPDEPGRGDVDALSDAEQRDEGSGTNSE